MALSKKININIYGQEISFLNAYHQITQLTGDKNSINICLTSYNSDSKEYKLDEKTYNFVPSVEDGSENFIKQGYEYLKTLENFKDAIDLLD